LTATAYYQLVALTAVYHGQGAPLDLTLQRGDKDPPFEFYF